MTISIFNQKHKETLGNAPGTLIYTGGDKDFNAYVESVFFNKEEVLVRKTSNVSDWKLEDKKGFLEWINVVGLHNEALFEKITTAYDIENLWLEDILNINQYPKLETTTDSFFVTLKMLRFDEKNKKIISEQLSLVVSNGVLLSFQENPGDVFDNVRQRLQNEIYRIRKRGTDYLAYALLDAVVDNYFLVVEQFGNAIEVLEESILSKTKDKNMLDKVYTHKREINFLRRQLRPVMEIIHGFEKAELNFLKKSTMPYFSDLKDHINQTIDSIELYHTLLNDLLSLHDAQNNQKLNETMKILTVFSVVFIPLTFLAGIYGTNFEHMPELHYKWAYPAFWCIQLGVAGTMLLYFKKKGWL
jgi:magnesium transporter